MRISRIAMVAGLACALSAPAMAQVHQVAFDWSASQGGHPRLDTCVAASSSRVLVATNQQFALFTRAGVEKDRKEYDETGFPFDPVHADPRVDYDPFSNRLWMVMQGPEGFLHVAVSKNSSPDTFGSADWHIYTESDAFDLRDIGAGTEYAGGVDHAAISFDEDYMWLTSIDGKAPPEPIVRQGIVAFPKTHDGGNKSILDGDPMTAADLAGVSPATLTPPDIRLYHFPIQELFEEVEEGQFFISESEPSGLATGHYDAIRLGGAYFDSGELEYQWVDIDVPTAADDYFVTGTDSNWPATPKAGWEVRPTPGPSSKFDSGVFARDSTEGGPLRIFTGHNVQVSTGGMSPEPDELTEFRWYVIDPDLGNFPGVNWDPKIEVVGRAPAGSISNGETYQGAITVNDLGAAFITFTRSGDSGSTAWPSLVRASLSANYTTVLAQLNSASQAGPAFWYDEGSGPVFNLGSDYADIQADFVHCGFWATGALVASNMSTPPAASEVRETWVTEYQVNCNLAEMNGDGAVDEFDLALFLDYYNEEDPRADMDRSGTITIEDYLIFSAEYARR